MKFAPALLLISLGLVFGSGGCGPGLEPPRAQSAGDVPHGPGSMGFMGAGSSANAAGTSAAAGNGSSVNGHAGSGGGNLNQAGAAGGAGAAGHTAIDAGVEDDGGS
jgi:hypothetical protein